MNPWPWAVGGGDNESNGKSNGKHDDSQDAPNRKFLLRRFTQYFLGYGEPSPVPISDEDSNEIRRNSTITVTTAKVEDDLYRCLQPLLRFGRIIGLIPISGLFRRRADVDSMKYRKNSLAHVTTALVIFAMILHTGVRVVMAAALFRATASNDLNEIAENVASVIFAIVGAYVYYFMYRSAPKLVSCLHSYLHHKHQLPRLHDHRLQRDVNLVAGILLTSAIVQNALTHWNVLPSAKATHLTLLETYYQKHFPKYSDVLPFNSAVVVYLFICDKWCVYAWTFGDILVAVIARAFCKQFQLHSEQIQREVAVMKNSKQYWIKILEEHEMIVELLEQFNDFLGPLIFACISSNIYFIAITLDRFLVSSPSTAPASKMERPYLILLGQVNSVWSFLQLLAKTFIAIAYCAQVNTNAHRLEGILRKCPLTAFSKDVERTEMKLRTIKIGFTGLDFFTITKPFILAVINVVFTLEIVLLQSAASSSATK